MTGSHKTVRALFAALVTILLAALTHLGAGGRISLLGIALVFVLVLWVAMILAGRRLGYITLGAILGLGQMLMHATMGWFTAAPRTITAATGHLGAHTHHATGTLDLSPAPLPHTHGASDTTMMLAHLGAVIATALVLKHGEDTVLRTLQLALGPVTMAVRSLCAATRALAEASVRIPHGHWRVPHAVTAAVVGGNHRRGPPALV
ncbi:hypothetical protein DFO66_11960 [Brevibacterium sanguinis]|uniref:MFS transporter n=2 Tax=Brevibacterium TaxID=1696 RepID=A0ABX9GLM8_9MICO